MSQHLLTNLTYVLKEFLCPMYPNNMQIALKRDFTKDSMGLD